MSIADLRQEYTRPSLDEKLVAAEPIEQFDRWFTDARQADILEPNAMTLATCDSTGTPDARIVLMKDFDEQGFVFYTSYLSTKAAQLKDNPQATLVFFWDKLARSVRVAGTVERVTREESAQYFAVRPRGSQVGAWASRQSQPIDSRDALAKRFHDVTAQYGEQTIPLPPFWGGYRVRPQRVEFWQGQPSRLHDRLRYTRQSDGSWRITRLAP